MQQDYQTTLEIQSLYTWLSSLTTSKQIKSLTRDFSDGTLVAEIIHQHFPKMIELHNYKQSSSTISKNYNWTTLNLRVFKKMGIYCEESLIYGIVHCKPGFIEVFLEELKRVIERRMQQKKKVSGRNTVDQAQYVDITRSIKETLEEQAQYVDITRETQDYEKQDAIEMLELKIKKLEKLLKLKDQKIDEFVTVLKDNGLIA